MEKIKIGETVLEFETAFSFDGEIKTLVKNGSYKYDMSRYAESLHKLDRTCYDTPGSIKHCACESCNTARGRYGKKSKKWTNSDYINHGEVVGTGKTISQIERLVNN